MTAEIAILNRSAVALAADSFVTVSTHAQPPQTKTYLANKLFTLSKYNPVGIMVYGNAELLGLPWETIIKQYRRELGERSFDTIDEYADDLISWLSADNPLFSDSEQRYHFFSTLVGSYSWLKREIDEKVKGRTEPDGKIEKREIESIARQVITEKHKLIADHEPLSYLPRNFGNQLRAVYRDEINKSRETVFGNFNLTATSIRQLTDIAVGCMIRDIWPDSGVSGVVIAGFGEKEKFPVVKAFSTHLILAGRLIYRTDDDNSHNLNDNEPHITPAAICPFAQRDVVDSFLQGIDPHIRNIVFRHLSDVLKEWPDIISKNLPAMTAADRNRLNKKLAKAGKEILDNFQSNLLKHVRKRHVRPMLETVSILPKEELAAMG